MTLDEQVAKQLHNWSGSFDRVVLAFSGGLDSCVLLHILATGEFKQKLLAWHVNHGLLECAAQMENFSKAFSAHYKVDFKISHLNLNNNQSNLEAQARKARYAEFEQSLGQTDILLTAHHADDQAETLFLNLMRGAGIAGLRGIARSKSVGKVQLLRPLLDISREALKQYAKQESLEWFEDPSNESERFDRNYLRHQVLPLLKKRWPGYLQSIRRACYIQSETQQLLDEVGETDYRHCQAGVLSLYQNKLTDLSVSRQKNVIRFWLRINNREGLPTGRLVELIKQLNASKQGHPLIQTRQYDIRIYHGQVYLLTRQNQPLLEPEYTLRGNDDLSIESIKLHIDRKKVLEHFKLSDEGQILSIRFKKPGLIQSDAKHRLKRLFQKHRIPPWLRDQTPQVYIDGKLKDLWLN